MSDEMDEALNKLYPEVNQTESPKNIDMNADYFDKKFTLKLL